jgi:hypothetical protein
VSKYYTPLKKDYSLFHERRAAFLQRKRERQKWEDSRQNTPRKPRTKNRSTLDAMRATIKAEQLPNKARPVCINLLPYYLPSLTDWKYLDEHNKVYFYQLALERAEATSKDLRLTPFTFNASNTLVDAFYSQKKKMADFLRDGFTGSLTKALGRPIPFYFVIETAGEGKLHLHGSMLIAEHEQPTVKQALEEVNREKMARFLIFGDRQKYIDLYGNLYATLNWADYILKEYRLNRIAYSLKALTASSTPMTRLAREYHADFRRQQKVRKTAQLKKQRLKNPLFGSW